MACCRWIIYFIVADTVDGADINEEVEQGSKDLSENATVVSTLIIDDTSNKAESHPDEDLVSESTADAQGKGQQTEKTTIAGLEDCSPEKQAEADGNETEQPAGFPMLPDADRIRDYTEQKTELPKSAEAVNIRNDTEQKTEVSLLAEAVGDDVADGGESNEIDKPPEVAENEQMCDNQHMEISSIKVAKIKMHLVLVLLAHSSSDLCCVCVHA